jgi:Cu+-exporting ATPase
MTVDPAAARASTQYKGRPYYFCCPSCLQKFETDPERYLAKPAGTDHEHAAAPPAPPAPGTTVEYTCPMHPDVISDRPGSCPICGMALEPRTVVLEEGPNPELVDMSRRFWIGLIPTAILFLLDMGRMLLFPRHHDQNATLFNWLQLILATPVVLWCGWPFFQRAWASLIHRSPNMFTLIALGVGAAYVYSVAATLAPWIFPEGFRSEGEVMPYFETAAMITELVLLGQVLELRARNRTSAAIRKLLGLAPRTARIVRPDGREEDIPLEQVQPGDVLRIRPGEKVPVDGVVIEGHSGVDEAMISGEPIPVEKEPGSQVISGTVNGTGTLLMRAQRVGADTLLAHIVRMVSEAQRSRAPVQRLADQVAAYFMPAVMGISILTFIGWSLWGQEPRLAHALVSAIAVLIIACPCALGLATPMAIMVGTGRGAELGVLIRHAEALETLEKADTLVVDKTGTLTEGKPKVDVIEPMGAHSADELVRLAASLEQASEHPLATAFVHAATERNLPLAEVSDFQSITGKGVVGTVEGHRVVVGTAALLDQQGIATVALQPRIYELGSEGHTVVLVAIDGRVAGIVTVSDPIRPTTPEAIRQLHADGLRIIMLTGDSRATARAVARGLGVDEVIAEVVPEEKREVVRRLQREGRTVVMAGDGINDAPALAQADVGIALGTGTDIAIESAGITLVHSDLRALARARSLSKATMRTIRQNLFLAFIYNTLSIPLAAFGILHPIVASAAMSLSSVSVVGNSLRLRRVS